MAEKIRVDYEELRKLTVQLDESADQVRELSKKIMAKKETLATSWTGSSAEEFQLEMDEFVLPALTRLYQALEKAGDLVIQVRALMINAEDEAIEQLPGEVSLREHMDYIEPWEGKEYGVYNDSEGIATIGVGFNLTKEGAREQIEALGLDYDEVLAGNQILNDEQINILLKADVENAMEEARELVSNFDDLPPAAQHIVVDMTYNLGKTRFAEFEETIKALESENFAKAAEEMKDSIWYGQVGNRSKHHVEIMRVLTSQS